MRLVSVDVDKVEREIVYSALNRVHASGRVNIERRCISSGRSTVKVRKALLGIVRLQLALH